MYDHVLQDCQKLILKIGFYAISLWPGGGEGGGVIHKLVQAQKICKMSAKFFKKWFLKFLKQFGNLQIKPVQNMHRKGGTGKVRRGPAWCQVLFGLVGLVWFGSFGSVWQVWFGFVNKADLKRPLVPLKVAKASLELHLETIPGRSGSVRSGPIVILRLTQSSCAGAGTELGNCGEKL